jgi:hypothetical protein
LVTLTNRTLVISKIEPAIQNDGTFVPATSGRLRLIDNGYGAFTTVNYCSAKEDARTNHSLPYPEIVVCSTGSHLAGDPSQSLAPTQYAYGSAEPRHFDASCDCWVFRGYERRVSLQNTGEPDDPPGRGKATISDAYPLDDFSFNRADSSATGRFLRYAAAGPP